MKRVVGDFAAHFALVGVEPKMGFHVAQIVVAAAGVRFIPWAQNGKRPGQEPDQRAREHSRQRTTMANVNHYFSSDPRRELRDAAKHRIIIRTRPRYGFRILHFDAIRRKQEAFFDQAAIYLNRGAVHRAGTFGTKRNATKGGEFIGTREAADGHRCGGLLLDFFDGDASILGALFEEFSEPVGQGETGADVVRVMVMPSAPYSLARVLARPATPARRQFESIRPSMGCFTDMEVMVMRRPQ